jgi:hypothetical protein
MNREKHIKKDLRKKMWNRDENLVRIFAKHIVKMLPWKVNEFLFAGESLL